MKFTATTIMASMNATRTEELAVMFDTEKPLHITTQAMQMDDPSYPYSWMEAAPAGGAATDGQPR